MTKDTIYRVPTPCFEFYRDFLTRLRSWLLLFPFYLWENRDSEWLNNLPKSLNLLNGSVGDQSHFCLTSISFCFSQYPTIPHRTSESRESGWKTIFREEGTDVHTAPTPFPRVSPSVWVSSWLAPPVTPCQAPKGHSYPFNSWIRAWQNSLFLYPFNTTETGW